MKRELKKTVVGLTSLTLSLLFITVFGIGLLQASVSVPDDSEFDIIGSIDIILSPGLEGPNGNTDEEKKKHTVLVVDGNYYEVHDELVIEHFKLPEASIEDLHSGDKVGFTLTAGGYVMELWVLGNGGKGWKRSHNQREGSSSFEQTDEPIPVFNVIKNKDGVWVN